MSSIHLIHHTILSSVHQKRRRPEMFFKNRVLKNFAKFTEKHLRWSLFLIKLQTLGQHRCFPVNFGKFLRTLILIEHLQTTASGSYIFFFTFKNMISRNSIPEVFRQKGVLKNFSKFIGKHLCQRFILIKLQASNL